jgi:uncharacterized membrane protein
MPALPTTPTLDRLSLTAQCLTVLRLGLMAGFFATYSANVNVATLELDGPTYALVQSAFNRNVRHAGFFICFFGPVPLGLLALATAWPARQTIWWRLLALAVLAYALGIVEFTRQVNLPLNHLTESWTPATLPPDWAGVREAWNRANLWRSGLSLLLFASGLIGLVLRLQAPSVLGRHSHD